MPTHPSTVTVIIYCSVGLCLFFVCCCCLLRFRRPSWTHSLALWSLRHKVVSTKFLLFKTCVFCRYYWWWVRLFSWRINPREGKVKLLGARDKQIVLTPKHNNNDSPQWICKVARARTHDVSSRCASVTSRNWKLPLRGNGAALSKQRLFIKLSISCW